MHLHLNNDRQGPGSEEMTRLALDIARVDKAACYRMADLGCGTGAQTLTLAQELQGEIVAVDLFETFLEKMQERIHNAHLKASVTSLATSIDHLPFAEGEFDIIWSEGAVYNIGFRKGTGYWKNFLKEGGILAVSELSWTTGSRPNELEQFWKEAYPEVDTVSNKIRVLEDLGYKVLGHFILPEYCWMENYYLPLLERHPFFMKEFGHLEVARNIVSMDKQEVDFYKQYKDYYSYGFYIAQRCKKERDGNLESPHRLVMAIMNVMATIEIRIPTTIFVVSASPKTSVPTRMAVTGSKTPSTEALVAPMLRVAMASVAVDTMVGSTASPTRFSQAVWPVSPVITPVSDNAILPKKTIVPTERA